MSGSPCGYCGHPQPLADTPHACAGCGRLLLGIHFDGATTLGAIAAAMLKGGEDTRFEVYCFTVITPQDAPPSVLFGVLDREDHKIDGRMIRIDPTPKPIQMILYCPHCGLQHVDGLDPSDPDWTNPVHRSHRCREIHGGCGFVWRPADVPTEGVKAIETKGEKDLVVGEQAYIHYDRLVRNSIRCIERRTGRATRWGHLTEVYGIGSSRAQELCVRFGFDPDEVVGFEPEEALDGG